MSFFILSLPCHCVTNPIEFQIIYPFESKLKDIFGEHKKRLEETLEAFLCVNWKTIRLWTGQFCNIATQVLD